MNPNMRKLLAILTISSWATFSLRTKRRSHRHERKNRNAGSCLDDRAGSRSPRRQDRCCWQQRCDGSPGRVRDTARRRRRAYRHSGIDRFTHSRGARRPHLCNRGKLDRCKDHPLRRWTGCARRPRRARHPGSSWRVAGANCNLRRSGGRRLAEVISAVPDNPAYIQLFYSAVLMTPKAQQALGISAEQLPAGMTAERAASGEATGWFGGTIVSISALFDRLPRPNFEDNVAGTRQFFTELNRLGVTGVVDPGGFSIYPSHYAALQKLWREKSLSVRVAYSLFAQNVGAEFEEYKNLTQFLPMGFGDDMLRFNGIGERITGAMYNNNAPDTAAKDKFLEIIRWAAKQGLTVTIHWQEDKSVHQLLDLYEEVNKETPIAPLRWSIAHLDNASPETLVRMKALGIGWTMQDAMYLGGDRLAAQAGEAARRMPPIVTALRTGVHVGAGTDAHRVASYNPFVALQWMLDGKTVGGLSTRGPDETPSREDALRLYTAGSAWFSFDETRRGTLENGKLADFAILTGISCRSPSSKLALRRRC